MSGRGMPRNESPQPVELHDHCVIGRDSYKRTWSNEAGAVEHAKRLLAGNKHAAGTCQRLFVVKVVKVVELPEPPMNVRNFVPEDLE